MFTLNIHLITLIKSINYSLVVQNKTKTQNISEIKLKNDDHTRHTSLITNTGYRIQSISTGDASLRTIRIQLQT